MTLTEYINHLPRNERADARRQIADACGVSESAVRHWCNGQRKMPVAKARAVCDLIGSPLEITDLVPELKSVIAA